MFGKEIFNMTMFMISSIFEIIAATFIIYGIFNEEKLVAFEEKIVKKIKNRSSKSNAVEYRAVSPTTLTAQHDTY